MTAITNLTGEIAPGQYGPIPLKAQLASADDGTYVPVVALDADTGITIGTVNQGTSPWVVGQPDQVSTGTINAATLNAAYTVNLANGEGIVGFNVSGLTASGATLTIEAQIGSASSWRPTNGFASSTGTTFTTLTTDQGFRVNVGGRTAIRLRVSSTGTGTITVASSAASVSDLVGISSPLPPGTNEIGFVGPSGSNGVDYSANAPSLSGLTLLATIPASSTRLGHFIQSQDTNGLTVALDDQAGSLTPTIIQLTGASSSNAQGASLSMSGMPHIGRIRIYGSTSSVQMAARTW